MKKLMFAALAGAAVMWFYDPANGAQRRDSLQRKLNRGQQGATLTPVRVPDLGATRSDAAMTASR